MFELIPDFAAVPAHATKLEAAQILYPGLVFDTALPQLWVNEALRAEFDVRPHFIWGYPAHNILGMPYPLTQEGYDWLRRRQNDS